MVDSSISHDWAALFTPDCEVTYPFGTHNGHEGLPKFAMKAELRFYRMNVSIFPNVLEMLLNGWFDSISLPTSPFRLPRLLWHMLDPSSSPFMQPMLRIWVRISLREGTITGLWRRRIMSGRSLSCILMLSGGWANLWA